MQYESDKIKCTEYLVYSKTSAKTVQKTVKKQKQKLLRHETSWKQKEWQSRELDENVGRGQCRREYQYLHLPRQTR